MRKAVMFVEDFGHEAVIGSLLDRYAARFNVQLGTNKYSVRGGHGRALSELGKYIYDLSKSRELWPDLLVVAIDSNCRGFSDCRAEIETIVETIGVPTALAVPDPHIERWLLLDSAAFKQVLGKGCDAPDLKCDRARYKTLLAQAVQNAGLSPLIGGIEHAEDIVVAMDLDRVRRSDKSLDRFLEQLDHVFRAWTAPSGPSALPKRVK